MGKNRVIISTFFNSSNYGSNLQAIALSESIQRLGYDVFFLQKFSVKSFLIQHPIMLLSRILNKINTRKLQSFFSPVQYTPSKERKERLHSFHQEYFHTISFYNAKTWNDAVKNRTIFVAGSDIIWNPALGYPTKMFLDFAYYANLPRFSYASSVGALTLPQKYYAAYRRYLGSMVEVGVREQSVADNLENIIGRKVQKVVDPTLLLTKEEWDFFGDKAQYSLEIPSKYIFCYFVMNDERYWKYVRKVCEATGLKVVVLPMHELDEQQPYIVIADGTPYEFVDLIRNAEFVLTDSFHSCVFSLIYQKEFYLIRRERKAEDSKYNDLLGRYGLMDRIIVDENTFERNASIDYEKAMITLGEDRECSKSYLAETLKKC